MRPYGGRKRDLDICGSRESLLTSIQRDSLAQGRGAASRTTATVLQEGFLGLFPRAQWPSEEPDMEAKGHVA